MYKRLVQIFLLSTFFIANGQNTFKSKRNNPNIIFILADDLGYETMPIYGGESYLTPNIDKMASEGISLDHCFSQPQCTPSRVKLLTGMYNVRNYVKFGLLDTSQKTVANVMRDAGYTTGVAGKWQLGKNPNNAEQLGFDESLLWQLTAPRAYDDGRDTRYSEPVLEQNGVLKKYSVDDYGPTIINDFSLDFIERHANDEKPFFLFYSMVLTHCPFSPTPDSAGWDEKREDVMTYKGSVENFGSMVNYMDKMVGRILEKVNQLGLSENTLIVFTGDNGTDKPVVSKMNGLDVAGGKLLSTDAGTRVPFVAKWPGKIKPNTRNHDLVDFSDFMPTFLEAANVKLSSTIQLDGRSFLPQLKGKKGNPREWVYSWYQNPMKNEPRVFARNHTYKLYDTGEFYNSAKDVLEENPLELNSLSQEQQLVYQQLKSVINDYSKRRLEEIK